MSTRALTIVLMETGALTGCYTLLLYVPHHTASAAALALLGTAALAYPVAGGWRGWPLVRIVNERSAARTGLFAALGWILVAFIVGWRPGTSPALLLAAVALLTSWLTGAALSTRIEVVSMTGLPLREKVANLGILSSAAGILAALLLGFVAWLYKWGHLDYLPLPLWHCYVFCLAGACIGVGAAISPAGPAAGSKQDTSRPYMWSPGSSQAVVSTWAVVAATASLTALRLLLPSSLRATMGLPDVVVAVLLGSLSVGGLVVAIVLRYWTGWQNRNLWLGVLLFCGCGSYVVVLRPFAVLETFGAGYPHDRLLLLLVLPFAGAAAVGALSQATLQHWGAKTSPASPPRRRPNIGSALFLGLICGALAVASWMGGLPTLVPVGMVFGILVVPALFHVYVSHWLYSDASARGRRAWPWVTSYWVLLQLPVLLVWILARPKQTRGLSEPAGSGDVGSDDHVRESRATQGGR